MKVKISYTTDFEEVPKECWRLLDKKISDGYKSADQLAIVDKALSTEPFDSFDTLNQIHKLRLILANYDQCLADIDTILTGFSNVRLQNHQQQNIMYNEPEQPQANEAEALLSVLKEKLQMVQQPQEDE
jgi:precorrin isomerase